MKTCSIFSLVSVKNNISTFYRDTLQDGVRVRERSEPNFNVFMKTFKDSVCRAKRTTINVPRHSFDLIRCVICSIFCGIALRREQSQIWHHFPSTVRIIKLDFNSPVCSILIIPNFTQHLSYRDYLIILPDVFCRNQVSKS